MTAWEWARRVWIIVLNGSLATMLLWFLFDVSVAEWREVVLGAVHVVLGGSLIAGIYLDLRNHPWRKTWNLGTQSIVALYPSLFFLWILITTERIDGMEAMLLVSSFWLLVAVAVTWWLYRRTAWPTDLPLP